MKPIFIKKYNFKLFDQILCHYGNDVELSYYDDKINEINWEFLSFNECSTAIMLLDKNINKIKSEKIFLNKKAIHIIEKIIKENKIKICYEFLAKNINATHIIEKYINKLDKWSWIGICYNEKAIHIIEKNLDKIDLNLLASNENALHIIEKNLDNTFERFKIIGSYFKDYRIVCFENDSNDNTREKIKNYDKTIVIDGNIKKVELKTL